MNIGLLTSTTLSDFWLKTLNPIIEDDSFNIKLAIIDNRPKSSISQKLRKNLKRGRGGYVLIMAFKSLFPEKIESIDTKKFCINHNIECFEVCDPYSEATIKRIKSYNLELLILTGGFGIIKKPLLQITPKGVLSYHHGDMRYYRGMPFAFWELYNNETEMGVTVQILSAGIDCGIPVLEKKFPIKKNDTLKRLQKRVINESSDMLYLALNKLVDKNFTPEKIDKYGKIYTLPSLWQWFSLNLKLICRRFKLDNFIFAN